MPLLNSALTPCNCATQSAMATALRLTCIASLDGSTIGRAAAAGLGAGTVVACIKCDDAGTAPGVTARSGLGGIGEINGFVVGILMVVSRKMFI